MEDRAETVDWSRARVFMVGIKGTGMTALAELLLSLGASVSGSDVEEEFYTDRILSELGVRVAARFDEERLPDALDLVIYSAAYDPDTNPQLRAARRRALPLMSFPEALGAFSRRLPSVAVSGVHGKTTTTAMVGTLVRRLGLDGSVLVGSGVSSFGGRSTLVQGDRFFVAETCEYRRHFLHFSPSVLLITSVEADHLDYFSGYADVRDAFVTFGERLAQEGTLVFCADDAGARETAAEIQRRRPDLSLISYGRSPDAAVRITEVREEPGRTTFRLAGVDVPFALPLPGAHNALNATAAFTVIRVLTEGGWTAADPAQVAAEETDPAQVAAALESFHGTARRSELVGTRDDVLIIDDYGHHPTAIAKTLEALRRFYPGRRMIVDFMSHTYSRTSALLDAFGACFDEADVVIINKIYASARESFSGSISGADLAEAVRRRHGAVYYAPELDEAAELVRALVRPGDLFVTLGAGNNWQIGRQLLHALEHSA